jgi:UDP-N-acetylglucosamine/UDP-N-acetylgalactosamine diphosphorylase
MTSLEPILKLLRNKGVTLHAPESVHIGEEVDVDRISGQGVFIYPGCRIYGKSTLIMDGVHLGKEAPVTLKNCQLGPGVKLKGGYFKSSVFLENSSAGSGSHVREGTIFEEQASIAHTVGLKQTILFPFVTLGSLINFCDCFMAGGTSRKEHSEVGSSYIHFNFTPNQDKATPSLIGDVPKGVMLDQSPIFLGGQGGLVGPCRIAFGSTIAAGSIYRKDELRPGRLLMETAGRGGSVPFATGFYRVVKRTFVNNVNYIGNLFALRQWYLHVRPLFISSKFSQPLLDALIFNVDVAINERLARLEAFCEKLPFSAQTYRQTTDSSSNSKLLAQKEELHQRWPDVKNVLHTCMDDHGEIATRDAFLKTVLKKAKGTEKDYIFTIQSLEPEMKNQGTSWLQGIVDQTMDHVMALLPSLNGGQ